MTMLVVAIPVFVLHPLTTSQPPFSQKTKVLSDTMDLSQFIPLLQVSTLPSVVPMIGNIVENGTVAVASAQTPSPATSDDIPANLNSSVSQQIDVIVKNDGLLLEISTSDNPTTMEPSLDAMMTSGVGWAAVERHQA